MYYPLCSNKGWFMDRNSKFECLKLGTTKYYPLCSNKDRFMDRNSKF